MIELLSNTVSLGGGGASNSKINYKVVETILERNNIPLGKRLIGSVCLVTSEGTKGTEYILIDGIENSNWQVKLGGTNGTFTSSDGSSIVVENGLITNITPVGFIENQMYDLVT